jgi:RNA polymerase sigma-70 factor (ECF subfamily)
VAATDWEVLSQYLAGDRKAFEELVRRYEPRLRNHLGRLFRQLEPDERHETVSDVLQEVWLRLYRHAANGDPTRKFSTWIYTIASNLAHNEHRNRKKRASTRVPLVRSTPSAPQQEMEPAAPDKDRPDIQCENRDLLEQLAEWLADNTSDDNAVALQMREVEGLSYDEIAKQLRIPVGTVKSRLSRGREAARRFLKAQA